MNKQNSVDDDVGRQPSKQSGLYPKAISATADVDQRSSVNTYESAVTDMRQQIWVRVTFWIERLAEDDPRRRLLKLAHLRRDVSLAHALLRDL